MRAWDYLQKLYKHWHAQTKQGTDNVRNLYRPTEIHFHSKCDCETGNQKFKRNALYPTLPTMGTTRKSSERATFKF